MKNIILSVLGLTLLLSVALIASTKSTAEEASSKIEEIIAQILPEAVTEKAAVQEEIAQVVPTETIAQEVIVEKTVAPVIEAIPEKAPVQKEIAQVVPTETIVPKVSIKEEVTQALTTPVEVSKTRDTVLAEKQVLRSSKIKAEIAKKELARAKNTKIREERIQQTNVKLHDKATKRAHT